MLRAIGAAFSGIDLDLFKATYDDDDEAVAMHERYKASQNNDAP